MTDYSMAEEFILPSKGKVYTQEVPAVVKLRSMTTQEEMKRLAPSEDAYKNICQIIDDCIVDDIGISSYDLCLADYQFLLQKLRVVTYGSNYNVTSTCPHCLSKNDGTINLDELEVVEYDGDNFTKLTEFVLPKTQKQVKIKIQTPRMIDTINAKSKELKKKSKGASGDATFLYTVQELIDTIDGNKLDPIKKEDFIRALPMMDTNYIMKHAQKLVESFGLKTSIDMTCPICGLDYTSTFRITSEFFGPSVDI